MADQPRRLLPDGPAIFTDLRGLEVLEAILGYAAINVEYINQAYHTGRPEPEGHIAVQGKVMPPITKFEVEELLNLVQNSIGP